ncbi:MAG: Ig-like domain-containing protein [Candidatus Krumholzibacteriia bacterium]
MLTVLFAAAAGAAVPVDLVLAPAGDQAGERLGWSVAAAADLNGDGWVDFIGGAPNAGPLSSLRGQVAVYYGGPGADAVPDLILTGAADGDRFGTSLAAVGDVNGDGFADLAVGAPYNDAGGAATDNVGSVYIYFGGAEPDSLPDIVLPGEAIGDLFGWSVAAAGDVDGDGRADLLVGAPFNDGGGAATDDRGRAYLFLGGDPPAVGPALVLTGVSAGDLFGWSVAGAGDVDGDGAPDLLVGALLRSRAYLFRGGDPAGPNPPDAVADLVLVGEAVDDRFGYAVAGPGDIDGDGLADLLVGALLNDAGGSNAGRAYVFYGRSGTGTLPAAAADRIYTGTGPDTWFGRAVAGAGDVDQDGLADVLVGAPYLDGGGPDPGHAYLFLGSGPAGAVRAADADLILGGEADGNKFGHAVAAGRDTAPHGRAHLLAGAPYNSAGGAQAGRLYAWRVDLPPNRAPIAVADAFTVIAGDTLTVAAPGVLANDSDPDGDPLHAVAVAPPLRGTFSLAADGGFVYRHDGSTAPADTFRYAAVDSQGAADTVMVVITIVDLTPPDPVTALRALPGHGRITLLWTDPTAPDLDSLEVWRARWNDGSGASAYPLYDGAPGNVPPVRPATRAAAAADTAWRQVAAVPAGVGTLADTVGTLAVRGVYAYVLFPRDLAGNYGASAPEAARATSYLLGDVASPGDGLVDQLDLAVFAAAFGASPADTVWDAACDIGPTGDGTARGIPLTDGIIDFDDLMPLAINFGARYVAPDPGQPGPQPVVLFDWRRVDERVWSLRLSVPHPDLKGVRLRAELPAGATATVMPGALLDLQGAPAYLGNVGSHGLDAGLALLGQEGVILGSGELLRVTLSAPGEPAALAIEARGVDNAPLLATLTPTTGIVPVALVATARVYPNPFNPATRVQFTLPAAQQLRIVVYRADGARVATLADGVFAAGPHELLWAGRDDGGHAVASGLYLCRLEAGAWRETLRMTLVK